MSPSSFDKDKLKSRYIFFRIILSLQFFVQKQNKFLVTLFVLHIHFQLINKLGFGGAFKIIDLILFSKYDLN